MCDDHYCHTPAPLPQLTLPMQMSLIASPRPSLLPNRLDDVHLLDLIKVMREGGRDGRMNGGVEEQRGEMKEGGGVGGGVGEWRKVEKQGKRNERLWHKNKMCVPFE